MQSKMTLKQQVRAACSKGHHEKELKILKYYLSQNPGYYMAYYMLGCYFYQHKMLKEAEKAVVKSLKLTTDLHKLDPFVVYLVAEINLAQGDPQAAMDTLNFACSLNLDRPLREHHLRANILFKMNKFGNSLSEYKLALLFAGSEPKLAKFFETKIHNITETIISHFAQANDKQIAIIDALNCITIKDSYLQEKCFAFLVKTAMELSKFSFAYTNCLIACQLFPENKDFESFLYLILQKRNEILTSKAL